MAAVEDGEQAEREAAEGADVDERELGPPGRGVLAREQRDRATDDSGNIQRVMTPVPVTVTPLGDANAVIDSVTSGTADIGDFRIDLDSHAIVEAFGADLEATRAHSRAA